MHQATDRGGMLPREPRAPRRSLTPLEQRLLRAAAAERGCLCLNRARREELFGREVAHSDELGLALRRLVREGRLAFGLCAERWKAHFVVALARGTAP